MEAILKEPILKTQQKINLIEGKFTSIEAADIINEVLEVKINFHKIQRLSLTEGDTSNKCEFDSSRIEELMKEQIIAKAFFSQAKLQGKKLKMTSTIHIEMED